METQIFMEVKNFVSVHCNIQPEQLNANTRLLEDLGLDGDDAAEFMDAFVNRFNLDAKEFVFNRHFGSEAGFNPLAALYDTLAKGKKKGLVSITLGDLAHWAEIKHWT